jgi:hypothetical protein
MCLSSKIDLPCWPFSMGWVALLRVQHVWYYERALCPFKVLTTNLHMHSDTQVRSKNGAEEWTA